MSKEKILKGETYLGIELGSTRIKAVLIDNTYAPIASGGYEWENRFENGFWTYSLDDIHNGIKGCFKDLAKNIYDEFGVVLERVGAMGISGMMHGYLAFDKDNNLLTPFRTWRNATTEQAAEKLTGEFGFNIPQRWSISHLYQAVLNREEHIGRISYITTLAGYIHFLLTGRHEVGIGEASGMFPIDGNSYNNEMLVKMEKLLEAEGYPMSLAEVLPKVMVAGDMGAALTEAGAKFLDPSGKFKAGIPMCPPEGDAGTGMVATNAVAPKTGNVSAGTSVFSMLVLENNIKGVYPELDVVTTPQGAPVAMVHCNNGCSELDAWVKLFGEFAALAGADMDKSGLYELLYKNAMKGDADCGGVVSYNYLAAEPVAGVETGSPMYFRNSAGRMSLSNFFRSQLYAAVAVLKIGMNILVDKENVKAENFKAHGGLFKVKGVAQQILADCLNTSVTVMETAGEGGAWGVALLAAYMMNKGEDTLAEWLDTAVFGGMKSETVDPQADGIDGFDKYFDEYIRGLSAQKVLNKG